MSCGGGNGKKIYELKLDFFHFFFENFKCIEKIDPG